MVSDRDSVPSQLGVFFVVTALAAALLVSIAVRDDPSPSSPRTADNNQVALVASTFTKATVRNVGLVGLSRMGRVGLRRGVRGAPRPLGSVVRSRPESVTGYATIGVTWRPPTDGPEDGLEVWARTRTAGEWSAWANFDYDAEHEPDVTSREGRLARAGTDPYPVGRVDDVQVRLRVDEGDTAPRGLRLAIVDPGEGLAGKEVPPAITGSASGSDGPQSGSTTDGATGQLSAASATLPPRPGIFTRAQWGADEKMRDAGSLHYERVTIGFVHHTVNANDYSREDVPALLRGIYAYHTRSKGWSDIGYNFVVDRFGRIWEGRYGGVDRAVVGAHTLGYNETAFAMSALGNFETTQPSAAMLDAYERLFAWKLGIHGVPAAAQRTAGGSTFSTVSGHSDADSTACPGRFLYAKLPDIRAGASDLQPSQARQLRQVETDLLGDDTADLIVRDVQSGNALIWRSRPVASDGQLHGRAIRTQVNLSSVNVIVNAGDWNGDGYADMVGRRSSDGQLVLYLGLERVRGSSLFAGPQALGVDAEGLTQIRNAGDVTGDGRPDLSAVARGTGDLKIIPSDGATGAGIRYSLGTARAGLNIPLGTWNADPAPDFLATRAGVAYMRPGNGPGRLDDNSRRIGGLRGYTSIHAAGDLTGDGRGDLVARRRSTHEVWVIPNSEGRLGEPQLLTERLPPFDLLG